MNQTLNPKPLSRQTDTNPTYREKNQKKNPRKYPKVVTVCLVVPSPLALAIAIGRTGGEVGGCELGVTNCPYLTKRKMEGLGEGCGW